jgi:hypothetical protein
MSHIRKRIQTAKLYEDEMDFELKYAKQERIVEERVRIANIKLRVHELACSPKWATDHSMLSTSSIPTMMMQN